VVADQSYALTGEIVGPRPAGPDVFWQLLELDFPVMGLSSLIRKECLWHTGLLRAGLIGIDDWDIFVRLAELYPVVITEDQMGIYRQPTRYSGQGSSARADQLRRVARHQLQLLQLPRAQAATPARRRRARRRLLNRIADTLLWNAALRLPQGQFQYARENISLALRLNPARVLRPGAYRKFFAAWSKKHQLQATRPV